MFGSQMRGTLRTVTCQANWAVFSELDAQIIGLAFGDNKDPISMIHPSLGHCIAPSAHWNWNVNLNEINIETETEIEIKTETEAEIEI